MPRLRRVDCSVPGITRRRRGRGFEYIDEEGRRISEPARLGRIKELAIPPAWRDVWICPHPMGHIQATGIDDAGRKQYRYHDRWRERRDREKFDSMVAFANALPRLRRRVAKDLKRTGPSRERVLACAARLLDRGFFRIGSEDYADENGTYGLATMHKRHASVDGARVVFDYRSKGGSRRVQALDDPDVAEVVRILKRRRRGGKELLAYKRGGRWVDVKSADINDYVREAAGGDFTAKDFRTWNATVLAAVALAVSAAARERSRTARKRAMTRAIKETARYLGNTPAVCRSSYIDPRVFDCFEGGLTIGGVLPELAGDAASWPDVHGAIEGAVLDLLERENSPGLAKVA
jgi:DNA topoisomerase IB